MLDTHHILPRDDLYPHTPAGDTCWCRPKTEEVYTEGGALAGWIVVHNAADGREAYERGERQPH